MRQKKKLQVFVSSTYTDLQEERQAAVQAILTAGHIPAGMELFAAGDQTQMTVIKKWIDESDVYMLILGGRYGSVDKESGKSYSHLEYEYAFCKNMPLFAVVMTDEYLQKKVQISGLDMMERQNQHLLKEFKDVVLKKMVKFFRDDRDIKLAVYETLLDFSQKEELKGWIPGDQEITPMVTEQLAQLTKENKELRKENEELRQKASALTYNGMTYEEMYNSLLTERLPLEKLKDESTLKLHQIARCFEDEAPALIHFFWLIQDKVVGSWDREELSEHFYQQIKVLTFPFGLLKEEIKEREIKMPQRADNRVIYPPIISIKSFITMTQLGRDFLSRVHREKPGAKEATKFLLQ
jgi:hypothetical protein